MEGNTPFTKYIVEKKILNVCDYFFLVDVGASGGIDFKWSVFKDQLRAVGFDPLIKECERLNLLTSNSNINYVPAFVGSGSIAESLSEKEREKKNNGPGRRLSCIKANEILKVSADDRYNSFQELIFSEDKITLDEYFSEPDYKIDFLKVDTDGHDIEVLQGAEQLLKNNNFLGLCVESQFHGELGTNANTFTNIDRLLRENGFTLFDLQIHRYSRRDLPGEFLISIPAQTDNGQVQWADAIYFRDFGDINYSKNWNYEIQKEEIIKLICLYEIHSLHDCAIELVNVHKDKLCDFIDIEKAIELLVPPINGMHSTLTDYQERFNKSISEMQFLQDGDIKKLSQQKKKELKKYNRVTFFGAGGRLIADFPEIKKYLNDDISIKVVDNDNRKWGEFICQHRIFSPDEIVDYKPDLVIIVSTYAQEILSQVLEIQNKNKLECRIICF